MPKAVPSNSMPWPDNLIYDFKLPTDTSPAEAEAFMNSLKTSDRNRQFLRLRYIEGKPYSEIAPAYGLAQTAVRMAIHRLWEKYSGDGTASPAMRGMDVPNSTSSDSATPDTAASDPIASDTMNTPLSLDKEQEITPDKQEAPPLSDMEAQPISDMEAQPISDMEAQNSEPMSNDRDVQDRLTSSKAELRALPPQSILMAHMALLAGLIPKPMLPPSPLFSLLPPFPLLPPFLPHW